MKKLLFKIGTFLYIAFIFLSLLTYHKEYNTVSTFEEVNGYIKDIILFDSLSLNEYKEMFSKYLEKDYYIDNFTFDNNYNNIVSNDINNIQIEKGNYLVSLNNYVNEYVNILDKYQMEDEKAKIINGNFIIIKISLVCTKDIYEELKKITIL